MKRNAMLVGASLFSCRVSVAVVTDVGGAFVWPEAAEASAEYRAKAQRRMRDKDVVVFEQEAGLES